jgi:hypothetical protein
MVKRLFDEKFINDNRQPIFSFVFDSYQFAVLPPSLMLPLQVVVVCSR